METIIVPVDGASNIKLEVLDYHSLAPMFSVTAPTPEETDGGLRYNASARQFAWYGKAVAALPADYRNGARVIAPAARGASGGLVGRDGSLAEVPGRGLTLSYSQEYPRPVEEAFAGLAGSEEEFYRQTGSILSYPGSLTLLKRFLFEQMERPEVLGRSEFFATYGVLLAGHFLGPDYREAARAAGNEHSYWMCHTGARNINNPPGTPSAVSRRIESFGSLVPEQPAVAYRALGNIPRGQAAALGLPPDVAVIPGGHDTCLSHLPVAAAYRAFSAGGDSRRLIHLEAGSWTMASLIGSTGTELPADGFRRAVIVQGTLDGEPVVTSMYGGGRDFRFLAGMLEKRGMRFSREGIEQRLEETVSAADCFVLPNIAPENHGTGPFPGLTGRITNPGRFFADGASALALADLCIANTAICQVETLSGDSPAPVVLTGGGSRDILLGRLLATLSGESVYLLLDSRGRVMSETTTLGAAMAGKAACTGVHPAEQPLAETGLRFRQLEPFGVSLAEKLAAYRRLFIEQIQIALEE